MKQKLVTSVLGIAISLSVAMPAFAESAPVFDADTMQQEDDLPMPPPPGQEGMGAVATPQPAMANAPGANVGTLDQRIRRLEQQTSHLQENGSAPKVESLQKEVQTLRGQVEQLTHQLQQVQTQQKAMYTDLDKRVAATPQQTPANTLDNASPTSDPIAPETATPTVAPKPAAKTAAKSSKATSATLMADNTTVAPAENSANTQAATDPQPNVAEEQQIYQTAYNYIKAKKYNDAINALQGMLQKYPSGQFASNAHYWLGELYGLIGKNDQALTEFGIVVKTYASSPRVSDAQLKIGLLYASQSKWSEAKGAFKKVINHYPGTASAKLATAQLKQIKEAGH